VNTASGTGMGGQRSGEEERSREEYV